MNDNYIYIKITQTGTNFAHHTFILITYYIYFKSCIPSLTLII